MRRPVDVTALILAQDLATAACGAFNAAYFGGYALDQAQARGRRVGALAMTFVGVAAVAEAAFSQTLLWSLAGNGPVDALFSPAGWALLRLPLLAATGFVTLLVWRRLRG